MPSQAGSGPKNNARRSTHSSRGRFGAPGAPPVGIDLSLHLTSHSAPRPRDPADRLVASARGFVPIAWWILFVPGDGVMGPYGLALITRTDAALDRLRRRGPEIRAAAGRHALGLRAIEAALTGAPSMFLRAELHELYERVPDLAKLCDLDRLDVWPQQLERGRIVATKQHGGSLADAVVGAVPEHAVELPDPATLEARTLAALRDGDSSELDLLEEALARQLVEAYAPWLELTRRRWGRGSLEAEAQEVLTALAEGRPEPFAPLARSYVHHAAYALSEAAGLCHDRRRWVLHRALRGATEPLAAPVALALKVACPSLDALYVAEWLDGGPPPWTVATPEAALACRLAAVGAPAWLLSPHDPIAAAERALGRRDAGFYGTAKPVALADAPDLAVSRALGLSAEAARGWLPEDAGDDALATAAGAAAEALCKSAREIDGPTRAALRDLAAPETPFLAGADRACVRLALGDLDALPTLLADEATRAAALVAALRSAGAGDRALDWLAARARSGDPAAAALVLDTPGADDTALAAARSAAEPALRYIPKIRDQWAEGLISTAELDRALADIAELARALGPDGAPLREALAD
ncbi:hypothetical protein [Nannocystis punicea]|uniref:Uncharacterized protein n=1 Tax=Nannocystis punicea TaxID=2995304 RepID=A0ABY7GXB9_9BACT|nr:hypothetical protein [Nannocystis poenicansa]WAS91611.1 hypothetical protein O0S08_35975 [Nannocystis poenicansa]